MAKYLAILLCTGRSKVSGMLCVVKSIGDVTMYNTIESDLIVVDMNSHGE